MPETMRVRKTIRIDNLEIRSFVMSPSPFRRESTRHYVPGIPYLSSTLSYYNNNLMLDLQNTPLGNQSFLSRGTVGPLPRTRFHQTPWIKCARFIVALEPCLERGFSTGSEFLKLAKRSASVNRDYFWQIWRRAVEGRPSPPGPSDRCPTCSAEAREPAAAAGIALSAGHF